MVFRQLVLVLCRTIEVEALKVDEVGLEIHFQICRKLKKNLGFFERLRNVFVYISVFDCFETLIMKYQAIIQCSLVKF